MKELPFITSEIKGIGGKIKDNAEDFKVNEIPVYEASGEGQHLFVNITKKNLTTKSVQKKISSKFNLRLRDIGFAGLKDKCSISTQTFSLPLQNLNMKEREIKEKLEELSKNIKDNEEIKINWVKPHKNKLRTGHLIGNEFEVIISEIDIEKEKAVERAKEIISRIQETGLPNYYGKQRFGIDRKNIKKGLGILKGNVKIRNKWLRRFLVSSYQAFLFNQYVKKRASSGIFGEILEGDIAKKHSTGGMFEVKDKGKEQERYLNKEISFTGPMYGFDFWQPPKNSEAKKLEDSILEENEISLQDFKKAKIKGIRRIGRIFIEDMKLEPVDKGIKIQFTLPKGSFATIFLREIIK